MPQKYQYDLPEHEVEYGVTVPVADLKIDPQAQRTLNEKRAQNLARDFILDAVGELIVNQRSDGSLYIVDGQHRHRAAQLLNLDTMRCEVHRGLDQTEEAILFLIKNRESTRPAAIDEYQIGITAGIPLFADTEKVVAAHGLKMGNTSTNMIGAVNGVLSITERYGADALDRVLTIAEAAWGRTADTWDGMLLGGLGELIGRHPDQINDAEFAKKLGKRAPAFQWRSRIVAIASEGSTQHTGTGSRRMTAYREFVGLWNRGRRSELTKILL